MNIQLTPAALRRALDLLDSGHHASLDELVETLILGTNGAVKAQEARPSDAQPRVVLELAARPSVRPACELSHPVAPAGQLHFLTNRFGPLKLATRVVANLSRGAAWPELSEFQRQAAVVARQIGQRLRAEDVEEKRRGVNRRWVAYPVGQDARAASERYGFSFTLLLGEFEATGPLAQLGLANIEDGHVALTERGWQLAVATSPTLDGDGSGTLSADEIGILRDCLLRLPDEAAAISEFLKAVRSGGGAQGRVDELLNVWHADWTVDRAAAERSAMLGRLGELGVLRVTGRGPNARIELVDSVEFGEARRERMRAT